MSTTTARGGTELVYSDWGKGQPIVLSHGWPPSQARHASPLHWLVKANGIALAKQAKAIASNAKVVVLEDTGHWILEERPKGTIDASVDFLR